MKPRRTRRADNAARKKKKTKKRRGFESLASLNSLSDLGFFGFRLGGSYHEFTEQRRTTPQRAGNIRSRRRGRRDHQRLPGFRRLQHDALGREPALQIVRSLQTSDIVLERAGTVKEEGLGFFL